MDNSTNNQNSFVNPDADGVNSKAHQKRIREFMQNSITDESDSNDDSDWFDAFDDALEDEQVKTPEKSDNKDAATEPQPSVIKETSLDNDQAAVSIKIEDSEEIEVDFLEDDLLDIDDTSLNNTDALNTESTDRLESTDSLNNVAQADSSNHVNDVDNVNNLNDSKLTSSQSLESQSVETAQTGNEPQTDKRTHSSDKLPDSQSTNPITQQPVDAPVNVTDAHINADNAHINNAPSNLALDPALDSQIDNAVVEMPNHSIQPSIQSQVVQQASDNVNYPAHDSVKENTQTATTYDAQIATDIAGNELGEITDKQINDEEIHPKLNEQEKIDESAEKIFAQLMQDETITTEYSPPSEPKTDDSIAETPDTDEFRAVFIHSQGLTGDESNQDTSTNQLADNTASAIKTMDTDGAIKSSLTAKPSNISDTKDARDTSIQDKSSISDTSGDISNSRPTSMDTAKNNNLFNDTQSTHTGEAQKNSTKAAIRQLKHANLANQKNFLAEDASVSIFDRLLYALMTGLGLGFVGLLIDLLVTILRSIMGMGNGNMIWLFTPVMALMGMVFGFISGREAGSDGMQLINFSGKEASNNASLSGEFYRGVGVAIFIASLAWIAMMLFA